MEGLGMEVYVVENGEYEWQETLAAFSTEERARKYVDGIKDKRCKWTEKTERGAILISSVHHWYAIRKLPVDFMEI